jgi:hypothetical protein
MGELAEYFNDLKEIAKEKRQKQFMPRLEYAIKEFERNNIPYKICNESIGHFNLYSKGKMVMSFWSYTGKCYIPAINYSDNIGIKKCIIKYKKLYRKDK